MKRFDNLAALPALSYAARRYLPQTSGVYVALDDDHRPLYIGHARNFRTRWNSHDMCPHMCRVPGTRIAWVEMPPDEAKALEPLLIAHHRPLFNRQYNPSAILHSPRIAEFSSPLALDAYRRSAAGMTWTQMAQHTQELIEDGLRARGLL